MDGLTELVKEFKENIIREVNRQEQYLKALEARLRELETRHAVTATKMMLFGSVAAVVITTFFNWLLKQ